MKANKIFFLIILFFCSGYGQSLIKYKPVADNRGLKNSRYVDELLKNQDYIKILDLIAGESDESYKIKWLTKKASEGHTLLMFELSRFLNVKGDFESVLKWFYAGLTRLQQDIKCYKTDDRIEDYIMGYFSEKYATCEEARHITEDQKKSALVNVQNIFKSAFTVIENIRNYPSPKWILELCLDEFVKSDVVLMSENQWKNLRKDGLDDFKSLVLDYISTQD